MAFFLERSDTNQEPVEAAIPLTAARRPLKYWQTILFAATALVVVAIAATLAATKVNSAIAGVAKKQVIALAEENTSRDALHIQSMVTGEAHHDWHG